MPVYNCAPFLRESVASVLAQTFDDLELILVDDGSSDGSWEVLQTLADKRLRSFRFERNVGVGFARNFAITKADSEYLAFLDADDLAHPARTCCPNCLPRLEAGHWSGGFCGMGYRLGAAIQIPV